MARRLEIILADEPTSTLDPFSIRKIEEQFLVLKNDYSLIVVTHILRQANGLADHIVFMYFGEIIEHGTLMKFLIILNQIFRRNSCKADIMGYKSVIRSAPFRNKMAISASDQIRIMNIMRFYDLQKKEVTQIVVG